MITAASWSPDSLLNINANQLTIYPQQASTIRILLLCYFHRDRQFQREHWRGDHPVQPGSSVFFYYNFQSKFQKKGGDCLWSPVVTASWKSKSYLVTRRAAFICHLHLQRKGSMESAPQECAGQELPTCLTSHPRLESHFSCDCLSSANQTGLITSTRQQYSQQQKLRICAHPHDFFSDISLLWQCGYGTNGLAFLP